MASRFPPSRRQLRLGSAPGSSEFRVLLSSSLKYGLTVGNYTSERISLAQLGREIVEPKSQEESHNASLKAALFPGTFVEIYEYFKGKKLPERSFFQNTATREFKVPREHAEQIVSIFTANMDFVGLIRTTKAGRWLSIEAASAAKSESHADDAGEAASTEEASRISDESTRESSDERLVAVKSNRRAEGSERRVFITHGKNKSFVDPIKKLLGFGELVPVVSVEQQSVSKPVPEKVLDDMRSCGAAIIHVDAEETLIDKEAKERTIINPNVLIEIGAAMALYGRRFILLVREGVKLPSNLQGLYEVRYREDALDGDATIRLLEAINDIKKNPLPASGLNLLRP